MSVSLAYHSATVQRLEDEIDTLAAMLREERRKRRALVRWCKNRLANTHDFGCSFNRFRRKPCDCGFHAAINGKRMMKREAKP